jgi:hypothetical protein
MLFLFCFIAFFCACQSDEHSPSNVDTSKKPVAAVDTSIHLQKPIDSIIPRNSYPQIKKVGGEWTLFLGPEMKKTLLKYDSDFVAWQIKDFVKTLGGESNYYIFNERQLPYAVIGDFNNDSTNDLILCGHDKSESLFIGILSEGKSYFVYKIGEFASHPKKLWIDDSTNTGFYERIVLYDPKELSDHNADFLHGQEAFLYLYGEVASELYYYQDRTFKKRLWGD